MKKTFHLSGMHCKSCEILLTDAIEDIDGSHVDHISFQKGTVSVSYTQASDEAKILQAITKCKYKPLKNGEKTTKAPIKRASTIGRLVLSGILLFFFFKMNVTFLMPSYDTLGFGVAFLVGLVASVSTCLAVTGGIIIGYTESIHDTTTGWITQLKFHAGRIISFIGAGLLLGVVGSQLTTSVIINALLSIIIGFVLVYLGAQILGLLPNIAKRGFHLPSSLTKKINKRKDPKYSPIIGAMTILLPCGFTQSMILFALQSHNPLQGAIFMGGFALGTLPVLLALGVGTEYIKDKLKFFNPLIASLLLVFGIFTITNGFTLIKALGTSMAPQDINNTSNNSQNISSDLQSNLPELPIENVQRSHNGGSFEPRTLTLKRGSNYNITVTPTSNGLGCMYEVVLPGQGVQRIIKDKPFVIKINGSFSKTINLVCSAMGMQQGSIIIQ